MKRRIFKTLRDIRKMQERQVRLVIIFLYSECSGTLQNSENALVRAA